MGLLQEDEVREEGELGVEEVEVEVDGDDGHP